MRRLLIRPGAIGDCVLSLPALEFLRTDYTEVWVPAPLIPLISFADRVCALSSTGLDLVGLGELPMNPKLADRLRSFDEIVSWYGTNREPFRAALNALGVPCRFHNALPVVSERVHAIDFFCEQVGAPLGGKPKITFRMEPVPRDAIVMHPFSGSVRKNWPLDAFRDLAARLTMPVEWLAGPEEVLPEAFRFSDLGSLAHWIAGARLYVGNDSGISHLAAAVGGPVVVLFRSTDPQVWAPRGDCVNVLQQEGLNVQTACDLIESLIRKTMVKC